MTRRVVVRLLQTQLRLVVQLQRLLVRRLVRVTRLRVGLSRLVAEHKFRFRTYMARLRVSRYSRSGLRIR